MTQVQQLTATTAISVCWGAVVLVWVIGAIYNAARGPRREGPRTSRSFVGRALALVVIVAVVAVVRLVPAHAWRALRVDSPGVTFAGLAILLAAATFTLWARVALGTMWSMDAAVKEGHRLRTQGPYGITRHPIYTGLLGMLLGSVLVAGVGRSVLVLAAGVVFFEVKIREEERLMSATFPGQYAGYRQRVPRLIPGLGRRRKDRGDDGTGSSQ
jgi:protein-S-isoprenylcysteine O-methyltransferase Ste14